MKIITVHMEFQGHRYAVKGDSNAIDRCIIQIVIDRIRIRVKQRKHAYRVCGKLDQYHKDIDELERRLKYLRKQDMPKALKGIELLMPLLHNIHPPRKSAHNESYRNFINELQEWAKTPYKYEVQ